MYVLDVGDASLFANFDGRTTTATAALQLCDGGGGGGGGGGGQKKYYIAADRQDRLVSTVLI